MKSIPLIRARYASNFVEILNRQAAPVEKYLENANLPVGLLENAEGLISAHSLWKFMGDAAIETGILDLGFWAGRAPVEDHGDVGSNVFHSICLHDAISVFCREAHAEYSENEFSLSYGPTTSWFCSTSSPGTPIQKQQEELYTLMMMTQAIQLFLGADWLPAMTRLKLTNERDVTNNSFLTNLNIEFNAQHTAIAIPTLLLATSNPVTENIADSDSLCISDPDTKTQSTDPLAALRFLLGRYIRHHQSPNINLAAEISGTSIRTLQRFLKRKGKTYTGLIDEVRFDLAVPLLNDESLTVTEISYELGYTNVAHFSRAFQRITGMYPSSYRGMLKK